jgi:hypothetical protein
MGKTEIQQTGPIWQSTPGTNIWIHNMRSQTGSVVLLHIERMKHVGDSAHYTVGYGFYT